MCSGPEYLVIVAVSGQVQNEAASAKIAQQKISHSTICFRGKRCVWVNETRCLRLRVYGAELGIVSITEVKETSLSRAFCLRAWAHLQQTICYRHDLVLAEHDMSGDQIDHTPGKFGLGSERWTSHLRTYLSTGDMMEELPGVHVHRHAALLGIQSWEPETSWCHGVQSQNDEIHTWLVR